MEDIFISIASYRDPETVPTIQDAIDKASNPSRLKFGICLQQEKDEISLSDVKNKYSEIRSIEYDWRMSYGACWARHNIQRLLYNDETYYLQLDSHHRFIKDWDSILIQHINYLKSQSILKPIVGGYCPGYHPLIKDDLDSKTIKMNAYADFTSDGDLMFMPKVVRDVSSKFNGLIPARFLSGHFIFSDGEFCKECLYDPHQYFRGEELTLSARAYTKGYDFFHPIIPVIWHEYIRQDKTKHWDNHIKNNGFIISADERASAGKARARQLLRMDTLRTNLGKYDIGNQRSLHEYELYAGLNLKGRRVHKYAYDINDVHGNPFIMPEDEWKNGLMSKFRVTFNVDQYMIEQCLSTPGFQFMAVIFENRHNRCVYRDDFKHPRFNGLALNNYSITIESSMEEEPHHVVLLFYSDIKKFFERTKISRIEIS